MQVLEAASANTAIKSAIGSGLEHQAPSNILGQFMRRSGQATLGNVKKLIRRTEQAHCQALLEWVSYQRINIPELALLFHIPNGGLRSKVEASILKSMGVKSGVPDYFLPVARHDFNGFFIEMKKPGESLRKEQYAWTTQLEIQGYLVEVFHDWQKAAERLTWYLK